MKSSKQVTLKLALALGTAFSFSNAIAAEWQASDGQPRDQFANSIAVWGDTVVSGSPYHKLNGSSAGAVYIYDVDGQNEIKVTPSDIQSGHTFGVRVDIWDNTVIAGATGGNSYKGVVYLYDTNGQNEVRITASDGQMMDYFGNDVAIWDNKIVVGAYYNDTKGDNAGAVYLYDSNGQNEIKITASDGQTNNNFGYSVDIRENRVIVGATGNSSNGAAYLYDSNGQNEIKVMASDGQSGDYFGTSVALSDNKVAVGAWGNDEKAFNAGAVYVYDANGQNEIKITASDGQLDDYFGWSVDISENNVMVGAINSDYNSINNGGGAAYLYDTNGQNEVKITASDGQSGDTFGNSVAMDGDTFVIGAAGAPEGTYAGKAYSGSLSSITTLDDGMTSKLIDGLSFRSNRDWIIGENTSGNKVTLSAGDTAEVTYSDKAVYVGKNAGSNSNQLVIQGTFIANQLVVGGVGNKDNQLYVSNTGDISGIEDIYLHIGSSLFFEDETELFSTLGSTELHMLDGGTWTVVTAANHDDLIARGILEVIYSAEGMLVRYGNIPEPAEVAAFLGMIALGLAFYRRKK